MTLIIEKIGFKDYVDKMEEEADDSIEVIFQEIVQSKEVHGIESTIFCFYEGKDDFKYYPNRINSILSEKNIDKGIYSKGCGCKENVVKVYTKLLLDASEIINSALFFVDRDFQRNSELGDNIYITPCYSIENLYARDRVFDDFLQNHCLISPRSVGTELQDYIELKRYYNSFLNDSLSNIILVNAWYSYQINNKVNESNLNLSKLKNLSSIIKYVEAGDLQKITINILKEITFGYVDVTEEDLQEEIDFIQSSLIDNSRGKYIEEILVEIYQKVIEECNMPNYFNISKRPIGVQVGKNTLKNTLLGQVGTPNCLREYLNKKIV